MISISRPANPPARLATKGPPAIAALRAAFELAPQDYLSGIKSFEFDSGIYGHRTVKDALILAQHKKCCFCESNVTAVAHGDVEHFRPKAGYQQLSTDPLSRPGYYWLAYEWTNLLFSCQICNQSRKRNLFPLANPTRRARSHRDEVTRERPLLVDPAAEDPTRFVGFRQEVAYPVRENRRGKATIEIVGLNRDDLCERRRTVLTLVEIAAKLVHDAKLAGRGADVAEQETSLRSMVEPTQEYSAMIRSTLKRFLPD